MSNPLPALFLVAPQIYGDTAPPPPTQEISHPFSQGAAEAVRPKMQTGFRLLLPLLPPSLPLACQNLKSPTDFLFLTERRRSIPQQARAGVKVPGKKCISKVQSGRKKLLPPPKNMLWKFADAQNSANILDENSYDLGYYAFHIFTLLRAAFFLRENGRLPKKIPELLSPFPLLLQNEMFGYRRLSRLAPASQGRKGRGRSSDQLTRNVVSLPLSSFPLFRSISLGQG